MAVAGAVAHRFRSSARPARAVAERDDAPPHRVLLTYDGGIAAEGRLAADAGWCAAQRIAVGLALTRSRWCAMAGSWPQVAAEADRACRQRALELLPDDLDVRYLELRRVVGPWALAAAAARLGCDAVAAPRGAWPRPLLQAALRRARLRPFPIPTTA